MHIRGVCADWAGPAFKFIQGYCDADVEADTGVVSYIFYLSNCLEIFTKSVPTHVTKNCSNVML